MSSSSSATLAPPLGTIASAAARRRKLRVRAGIVTGAARAFDFALLSAAGIATCLVVQWPRALPPSSEEVLVALVSAWASVSVLHHFDAYRLATLRMPLRPAAFATLLVGAGVFGAGAVMLHRQELASVQAIAAWWIIAALLAGAGRAAVMALVEFLGRSGRLAQRIAVVGESSSGEALRSRLEAARNPTIDVIGVFTPADADEVPAGSNVLAQLLSSDRNTGLDAVIVADADVNAGAVTALREAFDGRNIDLYLAGPAPLATTAGRLLRFGDVPALLLGGRPAARWQDTQKSVFDRIGAALLLLALLPVLVLIGIAVRLDSPGPALFRQWRTGLHGRPFLCLKFRSMYAHEADADCARQAVRGDRRVTRFGAWLRRTSLDELPQLLNVLRGDMSLVGPRPHAPNTRAAGFLFHEIVPEYEARHKVKPGITGWAQIHGWRGETPTVESVRERVRHDLYYVRNWSLLLDVRILLRTALIVLHDPAAF